MITACERIVYVLKADPDFAVFDRDDGKEAQHLGTWDEFTPAGLVVAKDAAFFAIAHDGDNHVLLMPKGERLTARQVMAGDGDELGRTVIMLPRGSGQ